MSYRLLKFLVQPVLLRVNEEGDPVAEAVADVDVVFTVEQLHEFADRFAERLEKLNSQE